MILYHRPMNLATHNLAHNASVLTQSTQFRKTTKSLIALSLAIPNIHGLVTQDYPAEEGEEEGHTKLF